MPIWSFCGMVWLWTSNEKMMERSEELDLTGGTEFRGGMGFNLTGGIFGIHTQTDHREIIHLIERADLLVEFGGKLRDRILEFAGSQAHQFREILVVGQPLGTGASPARSDLEGGFKTIAVKQQAIPGCKFDGFLFKGFVGKDAQQGAFAFQ